MIIRKKFGGIKETLGWRRMMSKKTTTQLDKL